MQNTHQPILYFRDRLAWNFARLVRFSIRITCTPLSQTVLLETLTGGADMIGAAILHFQCLIRKKNGSHLINTLVQEADKNRMHILTLMACIKMGRIKRLCILIPQILFVFIYGVLYILSSKTAYRLIGYLNEITVQSYTDCIASITRNQLKNTPLPDFSKRHWQFANDATLSDGLQAFKEDALKNQAINHQLAN